MLLSELLPLRLRKVKAASEKILGRKGDKGEQNGSTLRRR